SSVRVVPLLNGSPFTVTIWLARCASPMLTTGVTAVLVYAVVGTPEMLIDGGVASMVNVRETPVTSPSRLLAVTFRTYIPSAVMAVPSANVTPLSVADVPSRFGPVTATTGTTAVAEELPAAGG